MTRFRRFVRSMAVGRRLRSALGLSPPVPAVAHGEAGIDAVGHREYVGGQWDALGKLQLEFMVSRGLRPEHYFLDVACGSLRAGVHFIPYLEPEHYLGIDKEQKLVDAGLEHELDPSLRAQKRPHLVVSSSFEFERFGVRPDFGLAQSLFTHLTPELIRTCLSKLRPVLNDDGQFYATFLEVDTPRANLTNPHDAAEFVYTRDQMWALGDETGWDMDYIGDWKHPRGQIMVKYAPRR